MAFKDILVFADDGRGHEARLRLAVELARRNDAHLTAVFIITSLVPLHRDYDSLAGSG